MADLSGLRVAIFGSRRASEVDPLVEETARRARESLENR